MPSLRAGVLRGAVASALGAALVASAALTASPALASPDGSGVVINEVYSRGGSADAAYATKFVELYNPSDAAVTLNGLSLQYRAATTTNPASGVAVLTGSIPAKGYYLVAGGTNGTVGKALPTPDFTQASINPAAAGGVVYLTKGTTALTLPAGAAAGDANVIDLVGWGGANLFEKAVAPNPSANASSLNRANGVDSDDNSLDLAVKTDVTPMNSTSTGTPTDPTDPTEPTDPTDPTNPTDPGTPGTVTAIADIQGAGDTSPMTGQTVTTQGVVTATYATGGFNGYTIQTEGTGGALDLASHTKSDAIYVYSASTVGSVAIGDFVQVTGAVSEFKGSTDSRSLTEITVASASGLTKLTTTPKPVTPATVGLPRTDEQRESLESMLVLPQGAFTVSNTYSTNQYAEIGLASGTTPLITPTEIARPGTTEYTAAVADNAARAVTLDDGASINFLGAAANKDIALPWLTASKHVSVGATATFTSPVIFDWRNNTWKFQPTTQLLAGAPEPASFSDVRQAAPKTLSGDVRISSFNVLNYFPTTGAEQNCASGYTDRAGTKITVNSCGDAGPRGAWDATSLKRQQDKIVTAINKLTADVVSLEEIENSVKFGKDRDFGLKTLTDALNAAADTDEWAYVPSPAADKLPAVADQDVIRTAFIYKKATVEPVGSSVVLVGDSAFVNARQPLSQEFKLKGGADSTAFLAIVNHLKSKGSGSGADADQNDGQGASNASRVNQAKSLVSFAKSRQDATGVKRVYLLGDFNAYSKEDPIKVLEDAGYVDQGAKTGKHSYSFSGQSGSLDHILANTAGDLAVTGADIWNINSGESIAYEYSRYNYNATNFYTADQYRASDHDPVIVGLSLKAQPISLNLLNINDFHGRVGTLNADGTTTSNAVKFAGTIEKLRAAAGEANTLFLSDGDNIGASEFASSTERDQPTIDILNALELKASAVGNHEFDGGFSDLTDRVIGTSSKNAKWDYLGANVYKKGTTTPALPEYSIQTVGGLKVGIIGAVTQETPSLVSPSGIAGLDFGDPVAAVNRVAAQLTDGDLSNGEADILIAEYHEGASAGTPEKATLEQEIAGNGAFAKIVKETSAKVGVIFTGHTHKQYAWDGPVPGSTTGETRPVIQTGNYGENIGQVKLTIDPDTKKITGYTGANVARTTDSDASLAAAYPRVAAVKKIVDAALANAVVKGSVKVGSASADITTAFAGGNRDDRASESALGNLVADSLVASLKSADRGGATIGVVNPGGLRADLAKGDISFAQANAVLPFLNNLNTVTLTGAQFKEILEQQWQTNADGSIPSRPFLKLGLSKNVKYTYDPAAALNAHITSVTIDGEPLDLTAKYTIGTFSFLATGGDNFRSFTKGAVRDSGLIDRDAWIEYLTANQPVSPDFARRSAAVTGAPTGTVAQGTSFTLNIGGNDTLISKQGLDNTSKGAPLITEITATWPGSAADPQTFPVTAGAATATVTVPEDVGGATNVVLTAKETGATILVPVTVRDIVVIPPTDPTEPVTPPMGADDSALTIDLEGQITISVGSAVPGQTITISLGIEWAGQWVSAWLHSTPMSLGGWQQVAPDGTIQVTIPADAPAGAHRIAVQDADGNVIGWSAITIAAADPGTGSGNGAAGGSNAAASGSRGLAATGVDGSAGVLGALALLLAGAALVVVRRRRAEVQR